MTIQFLVEIYCCIKKISSLMTHRYVILWLNLGGGVIAMKVDERRSNPR